MNLKRTHFCGDLREENIGQEIILTPLSLKLRDFNISFPILTSSTGFSDKEILIVSPIPSKSNVPNPIDDFILPGKYDPASVIPKCQGYSVFLERSLYAPIDKKTSEDLTLTLKLKKF